MYKGEHLHLWELGTKSILDLETEKGILASSRNEIYGCIFGRDSLITSLSLISVYKKTGNEYFLTLVKKVLSNLALLQGKEVNIESGEEPGKCIHEFRPDNHEHLTQSGAHPWYVYSDNSMRNYDSVDATPLFLIAVYKFLEVREDEQFTGEIMPAVMASINWILNYGDTNKDGFIDYRFHPDRTYGGLKTQSWMDSTESIFYEHLDIEPRYPIAPLEVQAYTFAALKQWGEFLKREDLIEKANTLKKQFNDTFVLRHGARVGLAFAIDGEGWRLKNARSSMGHVLWAAHNGESILNQEFIAPLVERLFAKDLFVPKAGIRTLSNRSRFFDPASYHNGSIWPHDNAMLLEGLLNFGFVEEAKKVRECLIGIYSHFNTPIEVFVYRRGKLIPYEGACRNQAWSAASLLATLLH